MLNAKKLKLSSKKSMVIVLTAISLMAVGLTAGTTVLNSVEPTIAQADTWDYTLIHVEFDKRNDDVSYKDLKFANINIKPGQTRTFSMPKFAGFTPLYKTIKITESKTGAGITSNLDHKWVFYSQVATSKKTTTKPKVDPVKYATKKLSKQVKLAPGHNFFSHVPGSKYSYKTTHYGNTYKGRTVKVNMSAKRPGTKTPYYRVVIGKKTIGWIYGGALVNVTTYKTVKKTATVIAKPTNNFYNHVTSSIYATKLTHYGKTYKNKKVTINMQGTRQGTKTPYYRCAVNGKNIGWIYGGALSNVR
ncbi:GW dipeptide domain-containing protein [Pediococcus inopinatus]|uniref:GW dipeptide domain-containing protein n=1 Tax=Pediococcus inopinatus TaxID=114090 RepID=UPI0007C5C90D|nr:GW dipeptide domain-containing protein [Pediococcus inopinatus]